MPAKSFKVAVRTKWNRLKWAYNDLRFETPGQAYSYSEWLRRQWGAVVETAIHESQDPPNTNAPVPRDRYPVDREPHATSDEETMALALVLRTLVERWDTHALTCPYCSLFDKDSNAPLCTKGRGILHDIRQALKEGAQ